jgi:hypothetical protein
MTNQTPRTTPTPHPSPITDTADSGCRHWFYWIAPTLVAYCQDCPHSWRVSRPQSIGTGHFDPADIGQRGRCGLAGRAGAAR